MSLLHPDGISNSYLEGSVDISELQDYPKTVRAYQDARSELLRSSLVNNNKSTSKLTIHRLIQDCAKSKMSLERSVSVFSADVNMLWLKWPIDEPGVRHCKECELMCPHILRLRDYYTQASEGLQAVLINDLVWTQLMNELSGNAAIPPKRLTAITFRKKASNTLSSKSKLAKGLLAETHNNLAGSATELNRPREAMEHFVKYNKMLEEEHRRSPNDSDARLTSSCFNIGMSFSMLSQYEKAVEWLKKALAEAERLSEPRKVKLARSLALINLGMTYWFSENFDESHDILKRALREREEFLGPNDRQSMLTGRILHGLGNVRNSLGIFEESFDTHKKALLHFKETVGNNHHRTGNSLLQDCRALCPNWGSPGSH
ncbi:unnamed protein product [Clonostachys rosea f. rosea IK726]|nr:unnamed protein product [Clonostachys rosea f. rosea IK726]